MSQDNQLPDTLTPNSQLSEIAASLPPIWGRLVRRRPFISSIELRNETYLFGRQDSCDIFIDGKVMPPSMLKHLSKRHFIITRDYTSMPYIQDISKNGTYLNTVLIGKGESVALKDGDIIAVGVKFHEIFQFKDESTTSVSKYFDGKYKISRRLGKGAFGEVFLAIARGTCSRFAAKRIDMSSIDKNKIANEIKILETINHACVIKMIEAIYCPKGFVYILLDYMEGGDLQNRVLKNGKLSESTAKLYVYQIALAVKYLHSCGITHRDLKPENVLLASQKSNTVVKVTDFGMSKFVSQSSFLHSMCGTPLYVAPEILSTVDKASYTPLVDVWSLGCITYFTLWGRTPFQKDDEEYEDDEDCLPYLFARIRRGQFQIPSERGNNDQAVNFILRMLVLDPSQRIQVEEIFDHEWLTDYTMILAVRKLLE